MKYILLLLSCYTCFGQAGFGHFSDEPYLAGRYPVTSNYYGDLFLYVNAASANSTNGANNDVVTNLFDWGTNHWTLSYPTAQSSRWYNNGMMSNSLPCILQTNAGPVGVNGGVALPPQWMGADDTNWTIFQVALAKEPGSGGSEIFFYGEDGGGGGSQAYELSQGSWKLDLGNTGGGNDATSVSVGAQITNRWIIYMFQNSAGFSTIWTNNVQLVIAGPGITRAIGYFSSSSRPRFFGAQYFGAAYWIGAWNRIMMWKYGLDATTRTNYYNQLKIELGLTNLP